MSNRRSSEPTTPSPVYRPGARCPDCGQRLFTDLEAWFRACQRSLIRQIDRLARRRSGIDAEDIVQETFAALSHNTLRTVDNPGAWLTQVARFKLAKAFERNVGTPMAGDEIGTVTENTQQRITWTSMSRSPSLQATTDALEAVRIMAQLPNRQKTVSYLFFIQRWPQTEIASFLGISPVTVAGHVAAARETFKIYMQDDVGGNKIVHGVQRSAISMGDGPATYHEGSADRALSLWNTTTWVWCTHWNREPERWRSD